MKIAPLGCVPGSLQTLSGVRIAHLTETDGPGGAERVLSLLATELQSAGATSVAFLPVRREGWLEAELAPAGVTVEYVPLTRPFSPGYARALAAAFRRHRIELAHSHEFTMAFYGAWAARRAGIPHVITMHGSRYYAGRWRRRLALRAAVATSAGVAAVSRALAASLCSDLWLRHDRITVVPNGVRSPNGITAGLRAELGLGPADRLLLAVGNLYPVKGHHDLVVALAQLAARHPTLHAAIAGRGAVEPLLRQEAAARGVTHRLHLLGLRGDIGNLLASADVFVLPSHSEGLPLALLEAMFTARPIVATRVGEVPAVLAEGNAGLLVDPGSPDQLTLAIDRLLGDPSLARALGARARARAEAEFHVSRMVARYADLYRDALDRASYGRSVPTRFSPA